MNQARCVREAPEAHRRNQHQDADGADRERVAESIAACHGCRRWTCCWYRFRWRWRKLGRLRRFRGTSCMRSRVRVPVRGVHSHSLGGLCVCVRLSPDWQLWWDRFHIMQGYSSLRAGEIAVRQSSSAVDDALCACVANRQEQYHGSNQPHVCASVGLPFSFVRESIWTHLSCILPSCERKAARLAPIL